MAATTFVVAILLGALLAVPYVVFARDARHPRFLFGVGLAVAALIYVVFAALRGGGPRALLLEAGGVVLFGAAAVIGARRFPLLLAVGWAAHVAWDLLLHPVHASGYAPWWYPVLCIGFDLLVCGFLLATYLARPRSAGRAAARRQGGGRLRGKDSHLLPILLLLSVLAPGAAPTPLAGPTLCVDEAHHNVHTTTRGYPAFVKLARGGGFRVVPLASDWTAETLAPCALLVTVSPRGAGRERPLQERGRPAFADVELEAAAAWLAAGRGLLLVTDHAPIGAAARPLASRLGIDMSNAFTEDPEHTAPGGGYLVFSRSNGLLSSHPVTDGSAPGEAVEIVATFLGQSLAGPPGSTSFLTLGAGARDRFRTSTDRLWREPSPRDPLRSAAGRSQGLAFRFGAGRVVALADAAMLTALGRDSGFDTPGIDNRQLAVNILRWLSGDL